MPRGVRNTAGYEHKGKFARLYQEIKARYDYAHANRLNFDNDNEVELMDDIYNYTEHVITYKEMVKRYERYLANIGK